MEFKRKLNLIKLLENKSFFLFGPRSTGKSYLIREQLGERCKIIDLLDGYTHLRLLENPSILNEMLANISSKCIVVIDEVQKNPLLLDQVHQMIEKENRTFLLTGSSTRKLMRGGANLLAGRAWRADLFPLVYPEFNDFDLGQVLRFGGLPQVAASQMPQEELDAYVQTYLNVEIAAEGATRNLPQFARFLKTAALSNGEMMNFSSVARDAAVAPSTVRAYFQILEETLLGFMVESWADSRKRKAIERAKFYFFDLGVVHTICGTTALDRHSNLYGKSFEHWIALELRAYLSYSRLRHRLTYWRSTSGHEVDFVIGTIAIEVKASPKVSKRDLKGLQALREEGHHKTFICVSQDNLDRAIDGISCFHWNTFLRMLWNDELVVETE